MRGRLCSFMFFFFFSFSINEDRAFSMHWALR